MTTMIKLGEAYTELEMQMYGVTNYATAKKEWIKWKKVMFDVLNSNMKFDSLLEIVVYRIFDPNGLYDQLRKFEAA